MTTVLGLGFFVAGCASISGGPPRLFPIDEEMGFIRDGLRKLEREATDERSYRNKLIASRMYAIDLQYTAYESALTRERQNVGFGAAAATLGLTTASTLVASTGTKDILTQAAGFVTGTRAAYDNDILFAHSVQWIQTQMRARRADIARRLLDGTRRTTDQYPLAAALSDLEAYYRAGTFTGGVIATTETLGADARFSEDEKDERIEVTFARTPVGGSLMTCISRRSNAKARMLELKLVSETNLALMQVGGLPSEAETLLAAARRAGICP